jgi:hypothetical protein
LVNLKYIYKQSSTQHIKKYKKKFNKTYKKSSTQHIKKKKKKRGSIETLNDTNKTLKLRDRESQRERGDERETVQR